MTDQPWLQRVKGFGSKDAEKVRAIIAAISVKTILKESFRGIIIGACA